MSAAAASPGTWYDSLALSAGREAGPDASTASRASDAAASAITSVDAEDSQAAAAAVAADEVRPDDIQQL